MNRKSVQISSGGTVPCLLPTGAALYLEASAVCECEKSILFIHQLELTSKTISAVWSPSYCLCVMKYAYFIENL